MGRITAAGSGRLFCDWRAVVRYDRDSLRWESDLWVKSDRWWVNCEALDGAFVEIDCWRTLMAEVRLLAGIVWIRH